MVRVLPRGFLQKGQQKLGGLLEMSLYVSQSSLQAVHMQVKKY